MLYGLHRLGNIILDGVSEREEYSITCESFESTLQYLYNMTTEDVIDINQLDYEWLLRNAMDELLLFVQKFNISGIGLTESAMDIICVEADNDLQMCMKTHAEHYVSVFYTECIAEIDKIFSKGHDDLVEYLG